MHSDKQPSETQEHHLCVEARHPTRSSPDAADETIRISLHVPGEGSSSYFVASTVDLCLLVQFCMIKYSE